MTRKHLKIHAERNVIREKKRLEAIQNRISLDETQKEESPLLYHIRRETWRRQFVTHNYIVLTVFSISSFVNKTVF